MKILIVEDEVDLCRTMTTFFTKQEYICLGASTLFDAEEKLLVHQFDIVVLDIGLPDGSGLELLKIIKSTQENCNVLIVSAKNSLDDKLLGLTQGADDYITKPFHLAELHVRINVILRRNRHLEDSKLIFNELSLDLALKQLSVNDTFIELTRKEYELLLFFMENKNRVISKDSIAQHLWGESIELSVNYDFIYTHIKNVRKKILAHGGKDYLKSVYGMGYKFSDQ